MARYIVQLRETLVEQALTLTSTKGDPKSRTEQTQEVVRLRRKDKAYQEAREAVTEAASRTVTVGGPVSDGPPPVRDLPITGTIIAEMDDEEAARVQEELPGAVVLRDQPLELIRPVRSELPTKDSVEESDLWHLEAIGLTAARKNGFRGSGAGSTVAVLDTGIAPTHPELDGKVTRAVTFDSRLDVWEVKEMDPSEDTDGHGTHVAGLLCGEKVGVAPGVKVVNGVMIPEGRARSWFNFLIALNWVAYLPDVQIVNISAGLPDTGPQSISEQEIAVLEAEAEGLRKAGLLLVCAIGNDGRDRNRVPGNFNAPISVGASNRKGRVTNSSSGGTLFVGRKAYTVPNLVAPGEEVYSSVMGGGYEAWDGTSMVAPIVSGVAALVLEKYPDIGLLDLEGAILYMCSDLGFPVDRQGNGLVQVKEAI